MLLWINKHPSTNDETGKLITDDLINAMNGNAFINVVNNPRELYNHDLLLNRAEIPAVLFLISVVNIYCE